MGAEFAVQNFSLTMNRQFNVPAKDVYDAWTNIEAITSWFAPTKEMTTVVHELELRVGGKYHIEMIEPTGNSHNIQGEYVVLNPFEQIIFTWLWQSDEQKVNSLVTIDLTEKKGTTDMLLTHDKLDSQVLVDMHSEGWMGCLAQLDIFIN